MNKRILLIIFITCLALFFGGKLLRGKRSASFDPVIVAVDTAMVDHIKFVSGGDVKETFELKRTGSSWEAIQGETKVAAEQSSVQAILSPLLGLTAERVVTKESEKYPAYEITGEQAGSVTIWQGSKQVADLVIGGFRFDQAARKASSYIRKNNEPEVYLIDGFAGIGLKARFDQFRDKNLVKVAASDLTSLAWVDAKGKKQVLQKDDGTWYYAGMEALDSTAINAYLTGLVNAQGSSFSKLSSTQNLTLAEQLTLSGNNMLEPSILSLYVQQDTLNPFLIQSTANPDAIFNSDSLGLYKRIFADLRQFWPDGQ